MVMGGMSWTRQHGLYVSKSWCSCCCKVIVLLQVMYVSASTVNLEFGQFVSNPKAGVSVISNH